MSRFRSSGGEIVRLRIAREGVAAGSCGIVWCVYDGSPPSYEATFVNENGEPEDVTFDQDDVEQLSNVEVAPFPERLEEIRRALFGSE